MVIKEAKTPPPSPTSIVNGRFHTKRVEPSDDNHNDPATAYLITHGKEDLEGFVKPRHSRKTPFLITFSWVVLPQVLLVSLLIFYLFFGACIFRMLDEDLANETFWDVVLFEYGSLATIGWGNIYPKNDHSRMFAVIFSVFGIPLNLLIVANLCKYFTKAYWRFWQLCGFDVRSQICTEARMPIPVIFLCFILTFIVGAFFVKHNGEHFSVDDVYFSFISFATVGFGDKSPIVGSAWQLVITLAYMIWGITLTTALFTVLNDYMRKIHYMGRRFTGARDVPVWVGGQSLSVSQLLSIVGQEFEASPKEIRAMLHNLDEIIGETTTGKSSDDSVPLAQNIEDFDCYE